ncbi:MAG TPA: DUF2461 domain-containing protein, partial [Candidatus Kapabacteria bacterium]|nr:DUF2461 domain-containing protein [Candidatus Kapabacteria bacterium]
MAKAKSKAPLDLESPPPSFDGFTEATIKFLHGLKKNNNKEWFEAHREQYEMDLREPFKSLVNAMSDRFKNAKLPLVANPKSSLFRINRDIRFSKDKTPYKTHVGAWFPLESISKEDWAGTYFGFEPGKSSKDLKVWLGGGCYQPEPPQLKRIRQTISEEFKTLQKLLSDANFRKEYPDGFVEGEKLKRIPQGYSEDDPAAEYLKMKNFYFNA